MSEAKHTPTPGPWKWLGDNLEGPNYTDVIDLTVSCGRWCEGGTARARISEADRALIAACPDMLLALEVIASTLEALEEFENLRYIASSAIAKAKGGAQ